MINGSGSSGRSERRDIGHTPSARSWCWLSDAPPHRGDQPNGKLNHLQTTQGEISRSRHVAVQPVLDSQLDIGELRFVRFHVLQVGREPMIETSLLVPLLQHSSCIGHLWYFMRFLFTLLLLGTLAPTPFLLQFCFTDQRTVW